jgi:hypothetical protein
MTVVENDRLFANRMGNNAIEAVIVRPRYIMQCRPTEYMGKVIERPHARS